MSFILWNCRGMGIASTVKELKEVCVKSKSLVFLSETRMKKKKLDGIRRRKFQFNNAFYVDPVGLSGGLAVW